MKIEKRTGYRPDPKDGIYWSFEAELAPKLGATSGTIDLSTYFRGVPHQDQGKTNSCVAQSMVNALELKRVMAGHPHVDLSVLALYFTCRQRMNPKETDQDEGTYIWLAADSIRKLGVAPDAQWGWDLQKLYLNPGWPVFRTGAVHKIQSHFKIQSTGQARVDEIIRALLAGHPVVYGTEIGENWDDYRKGTVISHVNGQVNGRHATVLVGWDGVKAKGKNSWGDDSWGDDGCYYIDTDVLASPASNDFWVIVEGYETHA